MSVYKINIQVFADTNEEAQAVMDEIFKRLRDDTTPWVGLIHFVPVVPPDPPGETG